MPKLLLADEPTTALDVTIQAQVINLMKDIIKEYKMGVIAQEVQKVIPEVVHDELEYLGAIWKFDESKSNQRLIDGYPRRVLDVPIQLDQSLLASYGPNNLAEGQPISVTNLGSKQPESEKDNALNLD